MVTPVLADDVINYVLYDPGNRPKDIDLDGLRALLACALDCLRGCGSVEVA